MTAFATQMEFHSVGKISGILRNKQASGGPWWRTGIRSLMGVLGLFSLSLIFNVDMMLLSMGNRMFAKSIQRFSFLFFSSSLWTSKSVAISARLLVNDVRLSATLDY
jgi:hypothetical protein